MCFNIGSDEWDRTTDQVITDLCDFHHSLDYAMTIVFYYFRSSPSSLYTFLLLGLARHCHIIADLGFTEFDEFFK